MIRNTGMAAVVSEADLRFHSLVAAASGNPVLAALIEALGDRGRVWRGYVDHGVFGRARIEHEAIYDALAEGDPTRCRVRGRRVAQVELFLRAADDPASTPCEIDTEAISPTLAGPIN